MGMIRWASLMILLAGVFLATAEMAGAGREVPRMAPEELKDRLGSPGLVVLDVRQPPDWERSDMKIAGALREDPGQVEAWAGKYPKGKTVLLYCS